MQSTETTLTLSRLTLYTMKLLAKALSLVLISLPLLANAGTRSATMQVSFTVTDACTVQSAANNTAPVVACQLDSPHQLTQAAPAAVASNDTSTAIKGANGSTSTASAAPARAQDWTLYF